MLNHAAIELRAACLALGAAHVLLEALNAAIIGRVLLKVIKPEKSGTLALEDVRDPAEGIVEVPEGNAYAGLDLCAGGDGLRGIVS
jgi:hypothetical protein